MLSLLIPVALSQPALLPGQGGLPNSQTQFAGPPLGRPPISCPVGEVWCKPQTQPNLGVPCPPGPGMYECLQRRAREAQGLPPKLPAQTPKPTEMPQLNPPPGAGAGAPPAGAGGAPPGGERMAGTDNGGGNSAPNGDPAGSTTNPMSVPSGAAAIVPLVQEYFPKCTNELGYGTCTFKNLGIWGDARHRAGRSCHNSGEAWDIGLPFNCSSGGVIQPDDPKALEIAKCLATKADNKLGIIFKDIPFGPNMFPAGKRGMHNGHIHVQLRNCRSI